MTTIRRGLQVARWAPAAALAAGTVLQHRTAVRSLARFRTERAAATHPEPASFVVFLPLLREQSQVGPLLDHMCAMDYPAGHFILVPLTTRETQNPTTQDVIDQWCDARTGEQQPRVVPLMLTTPGTRKADQLNLGVGRLDELFTLMPPTDHEFVLVLDADSRPSHDLLHQAAITATRNPASLAMQAFSVFRPCSASVWSSAFSVRHTARQVQTEIPRQWRNNDHFTVSRSPRFGYMIGHGEFFRRDLLTRWRFPNDSLIDDLVMGQALNLLAHRIEVVPSADLADGPATLAQRISQTRTWAHSQADVQAIAQSTQGLEPGAPVTGPFRMWARIGVQQALWIFQAVGTAASLVGGPGPSAAWAAALVLSASLEQRHARDFAETNAMPVTTAPLWAVAAASVLEGVGPLRSMVDRVTGRSTPMNKTER